MRKIYFLLVAILVTTLSFGQELIINGDLEAWDDATTPSTWVVGGGDAQQETTDVHGGANALKRDGGSTFKLRQSLAVVAGENYTVSLWFKVVSERTSGTLVNNARLWSSWKDSSGNYLDNALQSPELKTYLTSYTVGTWVEYTATVNAPAGAAELLFEVRNYSDSVVLWDDISFVHNTTAQPGLSITSPSNGTTVPFGSDVILTYSITNFNVDTAGNGDGHFHYAIDGVDQGAQYVNTGSITISTADLPVGTYPLSMDLRDDAHQPLSPPVGASINITVAPVTQVADLGVLRADAVANGVGGFYELQGTPTVTYARTSRNQKYIQDAFGAILIDDNPGVITTTFVEGDGMSGLVGQTSEYNGVLQFSPSADATVVSGAVITPEVVTVGDLNANHEMYESELVEIQGVTFADAGTAFAGNTNYDFTDSATMNFRSSFSEADYVMNTDPVPTGAVDIIVFVGEYNGTPQVVARSLADLTADVSENTIKGFTMYPNPVNDVLNITTLQNLDKNVQIFNILGKQVLTEVITGTTVNVSKLNAGIYIIKVEEAGNVATSKLVIK